MGYRNFFSLDTDLGPSVIIPSFAVSGRDGVKCPGDENAVRVKAAAMAAAVITVRFPRVFFHECFIKTSDFL